MNKKTILTLGVTALCLSSCNIGTNNNSEKITFNGIYNFIVDVHNPEALAQASQSDYAFNEDYAKSTMDITASDIIINNQKYSFETSPMELKPKTVGKDVSYKGFSGTGNISSGGSTVSNFEGYMAAYYVLSSNSGNILDANYKFDYTISAPSTYMGNSYFFPMMEYDLNDSYHIKTIMPMSCYVGKSNVSSGNEPFSTDKTGYVVAIDFAKNVATVFGLGLEMTAEEVKDAPKVFKLENIPVKIGHTDYSIDEAAPSTKIPGTTSDDKQDFVTSQDYQVTDFSLRLTSADMTEVAISYKIAGKTVYFTGCSILKNAN